MVKLCDRQTLKEGTGTAWREFLAAQITASNYGETDIIDNPQELDGSILSFTPQLVACQTFIGARVRARLNRMAFGTFGRQAELAMSRKKDQDGLAIFAAASVTLAGTGTTLTNGHVMAGGVRIQTDATEPWSGTIAHVNHGYAKYDLELEINAGLGTYPIPSGLSQDVFRNGFSGKIDTIDFWVDGLIAVDATPDVRGGTFAAGTGGALVLVQGMSPWTQRKERPEKGYGGDDVWVKDEYIWGERSPGNWMYSTLSDGTAPTA